MKNSVFAIHPKLVIQLWLASVVAIAISLLMVLVPAFAYDFEDNISWQNPVVKDAVIGAGAGALTGAISKESSVGRGLIVGGLTGAGYGYIDKTSRLEDKPFLRRTLKGTVIGAGVNGARDKSVFKGAAVGAGSGVGYHLLRDYLDNRD